MKSDRVSLRADDAILAMNSLRSAIESLDVLLGKVDGEALQEIREERWRAYQRIAKALGLEPTPTTVPNAAPPQEVK